MTFEPVSIENLLSHQTWAMRLARRLVREEDDAEDLLQRTWIAALRHPPGSERGARAWLRKVILNLARERYRREQTRTRHELAGLGETRSASDAFELTSQKEICTLLGQQLLGLQEPYRTVLVQRFFDGLSSAEISRRTGVPSGTVRWRLKIGLDQLREELDRRSQGDRSKWVSALLAFMPRDVAPDSAEPGRGARTAAGGTGLLTASAWLGISAVFLAGGYFSFRTIEGRGSEARAGQSSAAYLPEGDALPSHPLSERVPLASLPPRPASAADESGAGLAILVVDEQDRPVPAARLFVATTRGFEARGMSDALGRARLAVHADDVEALALPISRGRVGIRALADGCAASKLAFVAPPFSDEQEVRLVIGGPETRLVGRILDERGQGVGGAEVAWLDALGKINLRPEDHSSQWFLSTRSDDEGRFVLRNLPPEPGRLLGFASGFALTTVSTLDLADSSDVALRLERGAAVSGRILRPDGRPAAGISVRTEPCTKATERATGLPGYEARLRGFEERTRTDDNGTFRLGAVSAGVRTLWALDPENELMATVTLALTEGVETRWDAGLGERPGLRLALVDEHHRPLAGWIAHVRRPADDGRWWIRRTTADERGHVVILDCPAEVALVDVFHPSGSGASFLSRRIVPGAEEQLLEIDTRAASSLAGVLLDSNGRPETDGRLAFFGSRTGLSTTVERAEDGGFAQRLPPGRYSLVLYRGQAAVILARVTLGYDQERDLGTLAAPPMGTLRLDGAALQNGSARAPYYTVNVEHTERGEPRYFLANRGPLEAETLLSLFAGRYRLVAFDGSDAPALEYDVEVLPFAETRLRLRP